MNKPPPSARVLATIYACSERSIRNYRAEGAPLDNPTAMFAWWSTRKNLPKGAAAKGLDAIRDAHAAVVGIAAATPHQAETSLVGADNAGAMYVPEDLPAGAEHELRWLANLAVEARRNLIRASKSGNAVTQKQALDSYIKVTESLRKFDNQVAVDRRDSGEVVTRAQVEEPITAFTAWVRRGIEDAINGACLLLAEADTPQRVYALIADPLRRCLGNAVDAATGDGKIPLWMKQAFERGL